MPAHTKDLSEKGQSLRLEASGTELPSQAERRFGMFLRLIELTQGVAAEVGDVMRDSLCTQVADPRGCSLPAARTVSGRAIGSR